jgi:predicted nuclease of predicted toxin-antitoxin system
MKLLLDESIPRQLAKSFPEKFEVLTVAQMGWSGTANGALLKLAKEHGFDALITADRGIAHQQNPSTLPVSVVVMIANRTRLQELQPLVQSVVDLLLKQTTIGVYHVAA